MGGSPKDRLGVRYGSHRVLQPDGVLPQAAERLDTSPNLWPGETRVRVEHLNLDAASFRQLWEKHQGDGTDTRLEVLDLIRQRGKMHNPTTGSGGMLVGTIEQLGANPPHHFTVGDRVASLVSLSLTPLVVEDDLIQWDGQSGQVPMHGYAVLFASSHMVKVPDDIPLSLALSVFDVCGAPALTERVVLSYREKGTRASVMVLGASGKSGSLSAVAARRAGADCVVGVAPNEDERALADSLSIFDQVVVADARLPLAVLDAVGRTFDVTVVCVDAYGCEHASILATHAGGTIVYFSMATSFQAAALGAEGLGADVTMLIGNGFVPGHAELALALFRDVTPLRRLFEQRLCRAYR